MALQSEYIKCDGYLHVRVTRTIDREYVAGARRTFAERSRACIEAGVGGMIVDVRDAIVEIDIGDRFDAGVAYAESPMAGIRVAVLALPSQTLPDGFFQKVAVNRGAMLRVCLDEAEAIAWARGNVKKAAEDAGV